MINTLKAWRFLYRRGFIEGFGHLSARLPNSDRFMLTRHSLTLDAKAEDFDPRGFVAKTRQVLIFRQWCV